MTISKSIAIVIFLHFVSLTIIHAQNWPQWRGPAGDGTSIESNLPLKWDSVTNVVWKSPVPGVGHSSPIIWEDRLFTASANPDTGEKFLLCYNAENGKLIWQKTVVKADLIRKHRDNSYASGTPAADGELVFVSFLEEDKVVVAAYDFEGKQVWLKKPGKFYSPHGFSCSPALYKDKVIINGNGKGEGSFLAALSKMDGKVLWKVEHENPAHSFCTPIFRELAGKTQMIFGGNKEIASYHPDTGEKYWFVPGPSEDFCSSPIYNSKNDVVIFSSAWPQRILMAIRPDGSGNVSDSHVLWQSKDGAMYVPSPISIDDYLFTTMTNGKVHCTKISSGKILWIEDLGKQYASPVLADDLVYMPNDEGVITIIKPGPTFEVVSKNSIGERMNASPAISKGKIFLRGYKHLFCIGN